MNYTTDTKVTFRVSTNRVCSECEETFTFGYLGVDEEFLNSTTEGELETFLDGMYSDWQSNQLASSWFIETE